MKKILVSLLALVGLLFAAGASRAAEASPLVLRAYPAAAVRAYPLDDMRGLQSLVLQNVSITNASGGPASVISIDIDLMSKGEAVDSRHLAGQALERMAQGGAQLQGSGAMQMFAFQFGDVLGPDGAHLPASTILAPGEAFLFTQQVFAWRGARDSVRVTVHATADGKPAAASLTLPILAAPPITEARYVFPLEGRWYVGAGPSFHTAHRWAVPEEFALDILKIGDGGLSYRGAGAQRGDYYDYGATVRAAGDGQVVTVVDGEPEDDSWFRKPGESLTDYSGRVQAMQAILLSRGADHAAGNYVMIRHPWGEYSLSAHLKPGSIKVRVGDQVTARQPIGQLGTTGGSTEPHLHFQICDGPGPLTCAGVPVAFKDLEIPGADYSRSIQSGDFVEAH
jgi:murein DD-endopeptidase MepM/ murein hydrolase activator NlpD